MAHKSRLAGYVIDCQGEDVAAAAAFWSAALGYEAEMLPDDPLYARLKSPEGEPQIMLQAVDHQSRIHLDFETDDKQAEVARLEKLGAKRIAEVKRWIVMEAPTGHRFCVCNPQRSDFETRAGEVD